LTGVSPNQEKQIPQIFWLLLVAWSGACTWEEWECHADSSNTLSVASVFVKFHDGAGQITEKDSRKEFTLDVLWKGGVYLPAF
jgi:hypothetical protein